MKTIFFSFFLLGASIGLSLAALAQQQQPEAVPEIIVSDPDQIAVLSHVSALIDAVSSRMTICTERQNKGADDCLCESKGPFLALKEAADQALEQYPAWHGKMVSFPSSGKDQGLATVGFKALKASHLPAACAGE